MPFDPSELPDSFWEIIQRADKNEDKLREILKGLSKDEIYKFAGNFAEAAVQLNDSPFLQYIGPGVSEDGVEDISHWVVSQGKDYYKKVWENPETIPQHIEGDDPQILHGIAENVYEEKFEEEMPDLYNDEGYPVFDQQSLE
jgi:hypothetical protein